MNAYPNERFTSSRQQLIDNGVLVDLSSRFQTEANQLYKYPIACSASVWNLIENAVHINITRQDTSNFTDEIIRNDVIEQIYATTVWDILWMSQKNIIQPIDDYRHIFAVLIATNKESSLHNFKLSFHLSDKKEQVITIMQPEEYHFEDLPKCRFDDQDPEIKVFLAINHYISTSDNLGQGNYMQDPEDPDQIILVVPVNKKRQEDLDNWDKLYSRLQELSSQINFALLPAQNSPDFIVNAISIKHNDLNALSYALVNKPGLLGWGTPKLMVDRQVIM